MGFCVFGTCVCWPITYNLGPESVQDKVIRFAAIQTQLTMFQRVKRWSSKLIETAPPSPSPHQVRSIHDESELIKLYRDEDETELQLMWENGGLEQAKQFVEELAANTTLKRLCLIHNRIGDDGAVSIVTTILKSISLEHLYLGINGICENGAGTIAKGLANNTTLRLLDVSCNIIHNDGAAAIANALRINKSLEELYLRDNGIGMAGAVAIARDLAGNMTLRRLDVSSNKMGDDGAAAIANALRINKSLETLDLQSNGIGVAGMASIAETLTRNNSLTTLYLSENNMGMALTSLADGLKVNTGLEWLWLNRCCIDDKGVTILADALKINATLACLYLADNIIGDDGAQAMLDVLNEHNTTLDYLDLDGNDNISTTILDAIDNVGGANEDDMRSDGQPIPLESAIDLEPAKQIFGEPVVTTSHTMRYIHDGKVKLNLMEEEIGADQAKQIAEELASSTTLKSLILYKNPIGDDGAVAIATTLQQSISLEHLDLGYNSIGDVGMTAVAQALSQNNSLKELNLIGNKISTVALTSLADALKVNMGLKRLWLDECSIDDKGVSILANALVINTTLALVDLWNNKISDVGAQAMLDVLNEYNTTLTNLSLRNNHEISPTMRSAIRLLIAANKDGTRSYFHPIPSGAPSRPLQTDSAIAPLQHCLLPETKPEQLPSAVASAGTRAPSPTAPTPVSSPPATTAASGSPRGNQLASLHCLSDDHQGPVGLPNHRAELEFEIRRLTAIRDACLATSDKNQWQQGIAAEDAIRQMQDEIATGRYPTSEELESLVDSLVNDIRQTVASDSLAAAMPLRDRLEQLEAELAKEREAEERVRQAISKTTKADSIEAGRRAVLAALDSTDPSDEIRPVPIDYLASITSNWTDLIGSGGFGVVCKGQDAVSGVVVAVKKVPNDRLRASEKKEFKNEVEVREHPKV
jgi:Ran GTPase-activating protein (RanGAP) involved in mRNA processing and transport